MLERLLGPETRLVKLLRDVRDRITKDTSVKLDPLNVRELCHLTEQGIPVTFISSFPRSGNTWMRMMVSDVLIATANREATETDSVVTDKVIPDIYCHRLDDRDPIMAERSKLAQSLGILFKSHETLNRLCHLVPSENQSYLRHLCLFRQPEDALVSYFHFFHLLPDQKHKTSCGIDRFCLKEVDHWKSFLESYLDEAQRHPQQVRLVSYENMLREPEKAVAECFDWLGLPADTTIIHNAVERRSFERLQMTERKTAADANQLFFRRGTSGSGQEELKETSLAIIREKTSSTLQRAHRIMASNRPRSISSRAA